MENTQTKFSSTKPITTENNPKKNEPEESKVPTDTKRTTQAIQETEKSKNLPEADANKEKSEAKAKIKLKPNAKAKNEEILNTITFVNSPTKNISTNAPLIDSQKNVSNATAQKSALQQQNRNDTIKDVAEHSTSQEKNLRTTSSLSAAMDAYTKEANKLVIPNTLSQQYLVNDKNLFFDRESKQVVIDASNKKVLRTRNNDEQTIQNMLQLATANKWASIKVNGTHEFKRETWAQATLAGIKVQGYTPTKEEKQFILARLKEQTEIKKTSEQATEKISDKQTNTMEQNRSKIAAIVADKITGLKKIFEKNQQQQQPKIETPTQSSNKEKTK
jgi:hypothetical protein